VFDYGFTLSSDYYFKVTRPEVLWSIAFKQLGDGIGYGNSLLIEDGETQPALFRVQGGYACRYYNDELFQGWLDSIHWNDQP
jgi:hypothetical protein